VKRRMFRLIAKGLVIIGIPIFLFLSYAVFRVVTYTGEYGPLPSDVVLPPVFLPLDISIISIGAIILR
jgi:ABC-type antimicrobial peptide transport system permease subunit